LTPSLPKRQQKRSRRPRHRRPPVHRPWRRALRRLQL